MGPFGGRQWCKGIVFIPTIGISTQGIWFDVFRTDVRSIPPEIDMVNHIVTIGVIHNIHLYIQCGPNNVVLDDGWDRSEDDIGYLDQCKSSKDIVVVVDIWLRLYDPDNPSLRENEW